MMGERVCVSSPLHCHAATRFIVGLPYILVLCVVGAFCLAPLAIYLLWLAQITRRDRPTMFSGSWDFVGLLFGLSGCVLVGGGLVLSLLQSNFRYWMRGNFESLRVAWGQEKVSWMLLAIAYLIIVAGWVTLTLLSRRRSLVVYNIDPVMFETTLTEVFEHLNQPIERRGNLWVAGVPLFELDRFSRGFTVTLRWIADNRLLFQEVDRLLRETVRSLYTDNNPSTHWLMAAAVGMGVSAVSCFGLLIYALNLLSR
jgi:hypothetical protein